MDQHHRMLASVLLILSILASIPVNGSHQENNQKLSATEEQEVREFARRLAARLEKTRDLSPYLNNPPASNLFDRAMTDDSDPIVDKDLASRVGRLSIAAVLYRAMEHRLLERVIYLRQVPIAENVCERSVASTAVPGPRLQVHETKSNDQEMVEKR
jgi:hypothetical protein